MEAQQLIKLNDYLYDGNTIFKIIKLYYNDLREHAEKTGSRIDWAHCNFLLEISQLLAHNDFLTAQSQRFREFYKYMTEVYPFLSFTFKGRIKSLIRAEEKFNGYIVSGIYHHYTEKGTFPNEADLIEKVSHFRDLIAYRIVISMPKCHLSDGEVKEAVEGDYLYKIANALIQFMEERGFTPELSGLSGDLACDTRLSAHAKPYFRDYVKHPRGPGYQSLHITFYDNLARCYIEVQLRTKAMDDYAEIGKAKHSVYENAQEEERLHREAVGFGASVYFDEAYERVRALTALDLSQVDVDMFTAVTDHLINDGCGLFRGRLILPYEHLSRFQNDVID